MLINAYTAKKKTPQRNHKTQKLNIPFFLMKLKKGLNAYNGQ